MLSQEIKKSKKIILVSVGAKTLGAARFVNQLIIDNGLKQIFYRSAIPLRIWRSWSFFKVF